MRFTRYSHYSAGVDKNKIKPPHHAVLSHLCAGLLWRKENKPLINSRGRKSVEISTLMGEEKKDERWITDVTWAAADCMWRQSLGFRARLTIWCHPCVRCSVSAAAHPRWTGQPPRQWNTPSLQWAVSKGWSDSLARGNHSWTLTKVKAQHKSNLQDYSNTAAKQSPTVAADLNFFISSDCSAKCETKTPRTAAQALHIGVFLDHLSRFSRYESRSFL